MFGNSIKILGKNLYESYQKFIDDCTLNLLPGDIRCEFLRHTYDDAQIFRASIRQFTEIQIRLGENSIFQTLPFSDVSQEADLHLYKDSRKTEIIGGEANTLKIVGQTAKRASLKTGGAINDKNEFAEVYEKHFLKAPEKQFGRKSASARKDKIFSIKELADELATGESAAKESAVNAGNNDSVNAECLKNKAPRISDDLYSGTLGKKQMPPGPALKNLSRKMSGHFKQRSNSQHIGHIKNSAVKNEKGEYFKENVFFYEQGGGFTNKAEIKIRQHEEESVKKSVEKEVNHKKFSEKNAREFGNETADPKKFFEYANFESKTEAQNPEQVKKAMTPYMDMVFESFIEEIQRDYERFYGER